MILEIIVLVVLCMAATLRMFQLEEIREELEATVLEQNELIMTMAMELQSYGSPNVKFVNAPKEEIQADKS